MLLEFRSQLLAINIHGAAICNAIQMEFIHVWKEICFLKIYRNSNEIYRRKNSIVARLINNSANKTSGKMTRQLDQPQERRYGGVKFIVIIDTHLQIVVRNPIAVMMQFRSSTRTERRIQSTARCSKATELSLHQANDREMELTGGAGCCSHPVVGRKDKSIQRRSQTMLQTTLPILGDVINLVS